jgi:hypothetical protein
VRARHERWSTGKDPQGGWHSDEFVSLIDLSQSGQLQSVIVAAQFARELSFASDQPNIGSFDHR